MGEVTEKSPQSTPEAPVLGWEALKLKPFENGPPTVSLLSPSQPPTSGDLFCELYPQFSKFPPGSGGDRHALGGKTGQVLLLCALAIQCLLS